MSMFTRCRGRGRGRGQFNKRMVGDVPGLKLPGVEGQTTLEVIMDPASMYPCGTPVCGLARFLVHKP